MPVKMLEDLIYILTLPFEVFMDYVEKYEDHQKDKPYKWNYLDTIQLIIVIVVSALASMIAIKIKLGM